MPSLRAANTGNAALVSDVKTSNGGQNAYTGAVTGALGTAKTHISAQKIRAEALLAEVAQLREKARAEAQRANDAAATGQAGAAATAAQIGRLEAALTAVLTELGRVVLPDNINISTNAPLASAIEVGITAALAANDVAAAAVAAATAAMTHLSMNTPEKRAVAAGVAAYKGMMAKYNAMTVAAGGAGASAPPPALPDAPTKNNAIAAAMVRGYTNNDVDPLAEGSGPAVRALIHQVLAAVRDAEVTPDALGAILANDQMGLQAGGAKKRRSTKKKSTSIKKKSTSTKKKSTSTNKKSTSTNKKSTVTKRKSTKKRSTKARK